MEQNLCFPVLFCFLSQMIDNKILTLNPTRDPRIVQSFKSKSKVAPVYLKMAVQVVRDYFEYLVIRNYLTMLNNYSLQAK